MTNYVDKYEKQSTLSGEVSTILSLPRSQVSIKESDLERMHWEEGMSLKDIAIELNTSQTSVMRLFDASEVNGRSPKEANELKLQNRPLREYQKEERMRKLWEKYESVSEIANVLGCSTSTVSDYLAKFDIREKDNHRQPHARYEFENSSMKGYCTWSAVGEVVAVHQLAVIAAGADPNDVFADAKKHVHHKNGHKFDNRPENLEVVNASEHGKMDQKRDPSPYTTKDLLRVVRFMLNPIEHLE